MNTQVVNVRKCLSALFAIGAWTCVWAGDDTDESVVASDEKVVWLGPDESVIAFGEADFALMPPEAQKIGDEVFAYVNADGALVVFGEGLKNPQFNLESLSGAIVFRAAIHADGSLYTVPTVVVPGHAMFLYGTESLTNPEWHEIDPNVPMQKSGYHFFKFVLK